MEQGDCVPRRLFWLLPLVFVVHDAEELATMPGWLAEHRATLDALARQGGLAASVAASAPVTTARAAAAIGLVLSVLLLVTAGASSSRSRAWFYAYCSFLGLLFLHVFTHVAQALWFRSYVPGLLGAVFVLLPGTAFIYQRLFAARLLDGRTAIVTALCGFVLFVPGALAAWTLGRMLAG